MSKKFSPLCQKILQGYQNCILRVYRNSLNEKTSWKKVLDFSYFFSQIEQKNFGSLSFFFDGVVKSVFYMSMGTLRRKLFSKNFFTISVLFRTMTGKKSAFRHALFGRFEKTAFHVSIDIFWGERFREKSFVRHFWTTTKNFPVVRTVFYVSRGTF